MKKIDILIVAILAIAYIIIWPPFAYSGAKWWTDMVFGEFSKVSSIALYWSYAFFGVLLSALVVIPVFLVVLKWKEEE